MEVSTAFHLLATVNIGCSWLDLLEARHNAGVGRLTQKEKYCGGCDRRTMSYEPCSRFLSFKICQLRWVAMRLNVISDESLVAGVVFIHLSSPVLTALAAPRRSSESDCNANVFDIRSQVKTNRRDCLSALNFHPANS